LWPATVPICKQLLPVYDKPMIYYPLSTLMLAGIREILVISSCEDIERFRLLLRDGSQWGISLSYATQERPDGIAQAFIIGAEFIGDSPCALVLGDNIFFGAGLSERLRSMVEPRPGATILGYWVRDPQRYGVVSIDEKGRPIDVVEKPKSTRSNWAVTGLYLYDNSVVEAARHLKPSSRGELEITDLNSFNLESGRLNVELLGRGFAWIDAGTHDALLEASEFIAAVERRQGQKIGCPEEIAFRQGFITSREMARLAAELSRSEYGTYLRGVLENG
jgi:glucose-1-phosphate thymidylyltransferase